MSAFVCEFCAQPSCTCQDGLAHVASPPHCADPACVAQCFLCQAAHANDHAADVAEDVRLTEGRR